MQKMLALLIFLLLILGGLESSIYIVEQDEKAAVLTWGVYSDTTGPGPHLKWPSPIQTIKKEKVTHVRRIEIGFRTTIPGVAGQPATYRDFKTTSVTNGQIIEGNLSGKRVENAPQKINRFGVTYSKKGFSFTWQMSDIGKAYSDA